MPRQAPPVLMLGTVRVNVVNQDELLLRLAVLYTEAAEIGLRSRAVEEKRRRRNAWLDANPRHPAYAERCAVVWSDRKEEERLMRDIHGLAKEANGLIAKMDDETIAIARRDVSAWAELGGVGIESMAWDLLPDPAWFGEVKER